MAQQTINLGVAPTGAGGDSARTAFEKMNANSAELYAAALPGTAAQKQAARDMFGLGSAATKAAQASVTDTTPGALMMLGAGGIAGEPIYIHNGDLNTVLLDGLYYGGGLANAPIASSTWLVSVLGTTAGSGRCVQTAWLVGTAPREFVRQSYNGVFGPWREQFHTGSILGTVSQTGGVPTGAIIERGSNANGEYVRYADGTQICFAYVLIDLSAVRTDFPPPASVVSSNVQGNGTGFPATTSTANIAKYPSIVCGTSSNGTWAVMNAAPSSGTLNVKLFSIGRWF